MILKKLLLKNQKGTPVASLTVRTGANASVTFPDKFTPIAALADDTLLPVPAQNILPLPPQTTAFSLLGNLDGERVFCTTLTGEQAAFARWRLLSLAEQEEQEALPLESPLEKGSEHNKKEGDFEQKNSAQAPTQGEPLVPRVELSERFDLTPAEAEQPLDKIARAKKMMEQGEPFSLFDKWMPDARWALIQNEECPFLVGIVKEGEDEKILYGVQGSRDYPPDDGTLWSFFPTSEDGEEGYYLTEEPQ